MASSSLRCIYWYCLLYKEVLKTTLLFQTSYFTVKYPFRQRSAAFLKISRKRKITNLTRIFWKEEAAIAVQLMKQLIAPRSVSLEVKCLTFQTRYSLPHTEFLRIGNKCYGQINKMLHTQRQRTGDIYCIEALKCGVYCKKHNKVHKTVRYFLPTLLLP